MKIDTLIKKLGERRVEIMLVLGLALVAFGLYSLASQTYPNINEFDPFYHARVVRELVKTGSIPVWEYMSYWPEGMQMWSLYPHLWHYLLAGAYWIAALVFTGSLAYNEPLFIKAVSWMVPLVGAFGVVSMYLLAKEVRGRKAGFIAAALFMLQPSWIYKAMYAEIEEDALGLSMLVFTLFAYVYALKRGGWKNALFAGLAMTAMLLSWRGSVYAAFLVAAIALWQALKCIVNKKHDELERTTEVFGLSIVPVAVLGFALNSIFMDTVYVVGVMGAATLLMVLANYWLNYHGKENKAKVFGYEKAVVYKGVCAVLVLGALAAGAVYGQYFVYQTLAGLQTGEKPIRLSYTIAENHAMTLEGIVSGLWIYGVFGVLALAYFPLRGVLKWKDVHNYDLLVGALLATAVIMYLGMNKYGYFFTPASTLAIGVLLADGIVLAKKLGKWAQALAIVVVLALLMSSAVTGFVQDEQLKAGYPVQNGWFKTMDWLRTTPEDTAFLTWWDYGHWTAFLGERHAIVDNSNINATKVELVAKIFTEFRANSTAELEQMVLPQMAEFKVTHVGVDRILLYSKWGALTFIADRQCIPTKTLAAYGLAFPELTEMSKTACGYGYTYSGDMGIAPCQKKVVGSEFGNESYYSCSFIQGASVEFTEAEWAEIKAMRWPGYLLAINTGNGTLSLRVYGTPDDQIMFFHAGGKLLQDAPINYMYGLRIFFKDPGFEHHELVENQWVPNEEVVAYKVNY